MTFNPLPKPTPENSAPVKKNWTYPPRPKPFHITDPFQDRGLWCFWLTADDEVLQFVNNLPCILSPAMMTPFQRQLKGRVMFCINPRYEYQEAWSWINDLLDCEAKRVDLDEQWEEAIGEAHDKPEAE